MDHRGLLAVLVGLDGVFFVLGESRSFAGLAWRVRHTFRMPAPLAGVSQAGRAHGKSRLRVGACRLAGDIRLPLVADSPHSRNVKQFCLARESICGGSVASRGNSSLFEPGFEPDRDTPSTLAMGWPAASVCLAIVACLMVLILLGTLPASTLVAVFAISIRRS